MAIAVYLSRKTVYPADAEGGCIVWYSLMFDFRCALLSSVVGPAGLNFTATNKGTCCYYTAPVCWGIGISTPDPNAQSNAQTIRFRDLVQCMYMRQTTDCPLTDWLTISISSLSLIISKTSGKHSIVLRSIVISDELFSKLPFHFNLNLIFTT